jgi:hypothetical protein
MQGLDYWDVLSYINVRHWKAMLSPLSANMLTLSSPVMAFGIILLILFFICYNFGDGKG